MSARGVNYPAKHGPGLLKDTKRFLIVLWEDQMSDRIERRECSSPCGRLILPERPDLHCEDHESCLLRLDELEVRVERLERLLEGDK